jgi:hypothetical protein
MAMMQTVGVSNGAERMRRYLEGKADRLNLN